MIPRDKTNLYLLSIVGIVAVVGIVVLILSSENQTFSVSTDESDIAGEAIAMTTSIKVISVQTPTCTDTDNGKDYEKKGKAYLDIVSLSTDDCDDSKTVREYYCQDTKTVSSTTEDCSDKETYGFAGSCDTSVCVTHSLGDIVYNNKKLDNGKELNLDFKLEDFDSSTIESSIFGRQYFTELNDEANSNHGFLANDVVYAKKGSDGHYYFDFTEDVDEVNVITQEAYFYLEQSSFNTVVVSLDAKVESDDISKKESLVVYSSDCSNPVYGIKIQDGKYHFMIIIDGVKYTLDSTTKVDTDWHNIIGTYDGRVIELYVSGKLEDSKKVSGEMLYDLNADLALVFGYNEACDDFDFDGYIDDVYIWSG